jgi:hypothetical protein
LTAGNIKENHMGENLGDVWFRSEETIHRFWRWRAGEDRGILEVWPKGFRFVGRERQFSLPRFESSETFLVRAPWSLTIAVGLLAGLMGAAESCQRYSELARMPHKPGYLEGCLVGSLIGCIGLSILVAWLLRKAFVVRWAEALYVDGEGIHRRAYFSRTNAFGSVLGIFPFLHNPFLERLRQAASNGPAE